MHEQQTDWPLPGVLSTAAHQVLVLNGGTAYTRLVVHGDGAPDAKAALTKLTPEQLFSRAIRNGEDARCVLSGLWLWHDWLDRSHEISQSLHTPSGSFWHAIMHRREGDFSNAKYWYARCRHHPVLQDMAARAAPVLASAPPNLHQLIDGGWNPDGFVDVVEAVHRRPDDPLYAAAVKLQRIEWQALFDHCARAAAG